MATYVHFDVWALLYLQSLTPLYFTLCLNNVELSRIHRAGLLLGEETDCGIFVAG